MCYCGGGDDFDVHRFHRRMDGRVDYGWHWNNSNNNRLHNRIILYRGLHIFYGWRARKKIIFINARVMAPLSMLLLFTDLRKRRKYYVINNNMPAYLYSITRNTPLTAIWLYVYLCYAVKWSINVQCEVKLYFILFDFSLVAGGCAYVKTSCLIAVWFEMGCAPNGPAPFIIVERI